MADEGITLEEMLEENRHQPAPAIYDPFQRSLLEDFFMWINWDVIIGLGAGLLCVGVIVLFGFAVVADSKHKDAMLAQCMADGKKEYQCHAMLDDHESVVPVFIPMSTGR